MENMLETFKRGEVVWAKLTGYPWWPGAVVEVNQNSKDRMASTCIVKFFGQDSHSILPLSKVANYSDCYAEFSKKGNTSKKLKQSIKIAENVLAGKMCVNKLLDRVKCTTFSIEQETNQPKNTAQSTDHPTKQTFDAQSIQTSFFSSDQVEDKKIVEQVAEKSVLEVEELNPNDQEVMIELQQMGLNEQNVIDVLQYGLIKRLALVDKQKAQEMKKKAKKLLIKKYFSKIVPKRITLKQSKLQKNKQSKETNKIPVVIKTKKISKCQKEAKIQKPVSDIESLCVKRLYNILKLYQLDAQLIRKISVHVVQKLKIKYQIQTPWFQKSYLSFIEEVKRRGDNPADILTYCNKYYQEPIKRNIE